MKRHYIDELIARRPALAVCRADIERAADLLAHCYQHGGKALACGNGGSCADADHIVGELMKGFARKRPLDPDLQGKLTALGGADLAAKLQTPLRAVNLASMPALSTAFANDVDAGLVFAQMALGYADAGDVFIGISTSGDARNVRAAAIVAKAKGARLIGLTGEAGGNMRESGLYDALICVPERVTHLTQEAHIAVYHAICLAVEEAVFGDGL